ncbi:septum formation family protein [Micromonospora sp. NPDC048909]|uniref:septum formation family protein n=1 Tax=Micromonospora sp. NPDC048909 TaxID=3155643 RepID=UPI0033D25443
MADGVESVRSRNRSVLPRPSIGLPAMVRTRHRRAVGCLMLPVTNFPDPLEGRQMRRRLLMGGVTALVTVLASGCVAPPAGTDGDLLDDWRPLAAAQQFTPRVGDCHAISDPPTAENHTPVDCGQPHLLETIHVGTFTGALAQRPTPPPFWSSVMRPAFAECDAEARKFVGEDWRDGRLAVQAVPPSAQGWQGGARWFRCDMFVLSRQSSANGADDAIMKHVGSLRGALKPPSPLAHACFDLDEWYALEPVTCINPHRYEYVGIWTSPLERRADVERDSASVHARCRELVNRFAKVPAGGEVGTGTLYRLPSPQGWARGDRGLRCYFWTGGPAVSRSVRGGGVRAIEIE